MHSTTYLFQTLFQKGVVLKIFHSQSKLDPRNDKGYPHLQPTVISLPYPMLQDNSSVVPRASNIKSSLLRRSPLYKLEVPTLQTISLLLLS
jgi:hypothetical protein